MSLLRIENLDAWYGHFQALFGVSLSVQPGECLALVGANGAGKTTLLRALMGAVAHRADAAMFRDLDISTLSEVQMARAGVALVPEGRQLFEDMSVADNLRIGSDLGREGPWDIAAVEVLFPTLSKFSKTPAGLLSGGQQQMVAIGRALMMNPDLLLVDEASLGLAPVVVDEVYDALSNLRGTVSIILVEQDLHRAVSFADKFCCLLSGHISLSGPCEGADFEAIAAAYFGDEVA